MRMRKGGSRGGVVLLFAVVLISPSVAQQAAASPLLLDLALVSKQTVDSVTLTCPLTEAPEECFLEITMVSGMKVICDGFGAQPHPCDNIEVVEGDLVTASGKGVLYQGVLAVEAAADSIFVSTPAL